tara:strand:- start:193 stop:318 length:126 start_codon:yes stop_codon:yes gene_type:complete
MLLFISDGIGNLGFNFVEYKFPQDKTISGIANFVIMKHYEK